MLHITVQSSMSNRLPYYKCLTHMFLKGAPGHQLLVMRLTRVTHASASWLVSVMIILVESFHAWMISVRLFCTAEHYKGNLTPPCTLYTRLCTLLFVNVPLGIWAPMVDQPWRPQHQPHLLQQGHLLDHLERKIQNDIMIILKTQKLRMFIFYY